MITYCILGFTIVFSLIGMNDRNFFVKYLFNPYRLNGNKKEWYTLFTHAFLHANYAHLFLNMFVLYNFGLLLEQNIFPHYFPKHAAYYYVLLYFGGMMVSSFPSFEKHKFDPAYSAVGASGAIFAIFFAYILIRPTDMLELFLIPIPIPAFALGIVYLGYEWYMSRRGGTKIGHDAHLWGGLFGIVFTIILHYQFVPGFIAQITELFKS